MQKTIISHSSFGFHLTHPYSTLEKQSHILVVTLGAILGAIFALFIGYHLNASLENLLLLSALPICLSYLLRKVYIYTVIHYQE